MKFRIIKKALSILIAVVMLIPAGIMTAVPADAASNIANITIDAVTRKYKEAASFLQLCNNFRSDLNLSAWKMDAGLLEQAMVKAAELAVYVDEKNLDGSSFLNGSSTEKRGVVVGYDVTNNSALITAFQDDPAYMSYFHSKDFKSVGVGVCQVLKKKYICLLLSDKTPVPVDDSVLTQSNQVISQDTRCKTEYLSNCKLNFNDNDQILCGGNTVMRLIVTNKFYPDAQAYISGKSCNITSTDLNVFKPNDDGTILGIKPGTSIITLKLKDDASIMAKATLKAVAKTFAGCTIADIPDQIYSGNALTPAVSIVSNEGVKLEVGKHYTLTYSNNINVGTAVVKITGIGAYSGASSSVNFQIVSNPSAFSVSVKSSVPAVEIGQTANIIASVTNATTPVKYKFESAPQGSSSFTTIQAESTSSTCVYKPTTTGTFTIRVTATDASGKVAMSNVLVEVCTAISLSVSLSSNTLTLGNTITINAKASGGSSPYQFAYYVLEPGKSTYTSLASYGSLQTLTYTPAANGTYQIRVDCKGSNGIVATKNAVFSVGTTTLTNNSTVSATTVNTGTSVTLTGAATGGVSPYKYAFYYKLSSASSYTTIGTAFGSATTGSFTPTTAGTYNVKITVKDNNGSTADKTYNITVNEPVSNLVNNSTVSATSVTTGTAVTLSGKASGGTTPYKYAFYYKLSTASSYTTIGTAFGSATTGSFTPTTAGTYNVKITVKDNASKTADKTYNVAVTAPLANNSTISATKQNTGATVTLTGKASGGTTPYKYAFYYKLSSATNWTTLGTAYGTATTASFAPTKSGTYNIKISVKDNKGTVADKTLTYTALDPLVNKSTLNASKLPAGNPVIITGAASGGTAPYKYAFYYKRTTSTKWNTLGTEYGTETTAKFTPQQEADFDIKVNVRDNNGTIVTKKLSFIAASPLVNNSQVSTLRAIVGTKLTLTGAASGGTAPYKYAFLYKLSTASKWVTLGTAYDGSTTASFKPGNIGTYDIRINVKDSTGGVTSKSFSVKTADLSNDSLVDYLKVGVGTTVTIKGKASGGNPAYKYAFYFKRSTNTSWNAIGTAYDGTTSATFTPSAKASYNIKVNVKDSQGFIAAKTFTVTACDLENTSSVSSSRVGAGNTVTINGGAKGGSGSYKYAFYFKRSTNTSWNLLGTAFGTDTKASFKPTSAAVFNVRIIAKDSNNAVSVKTLSVTATDLENLSVVNYSKVGAGTTVTIKGKASGGKTAYKYAFYFKRSANTNWNIIGTAYDGSGSATFTPTAAADYDVKVIVKDASSTIAVKTMKVTASNLSNTSTLSASTVKKGTKVTIKGKATGGTTPYKYAYYYRRSGNTTWNTLGTEFGTATSATLTPSAAATYEIKTIIKDSKGAVSIRLLTLKST